jgi:hypothetical protein
MMSDDRVLEVTGMTEKGSSNILACFDEGAREEGDKPPPKKPKGSQAAAALPGSQAAAALPGTTAAAAADPTPQGDATPTPPECSLEKAKSLMQDCKDKATQARERAMVIEANVLSDTLPSQLRDYAVESEKSYTVLNKLVSAKKTDTAAYQPVFNHVEGWAAWYLHVYIICSTSKYVRPLNMFDL